MKRTVAREIAVQILYGAETAGSSFSESCDSFLNEEHYSSLAEECELYSELPDDTQLEYIRRLTTLADEHKEDIDGIISRLSTTRKLNRISGTALAVLRCALCEIIYMDDIPDRAAINSAVEIAKSYDEPETVSFINGILGAYMRENGGKE